MKISDRDKKLILLVLLAAIIALPIFFYIKPKRESIKSMDEELVSLNERYDYLKALSEKQPFYESEIARLSTERDNLIKGFAQGIRQENTIMFLRDIELTFPMEMTVEDYDEYVYTPVSSGKVNENGELEGDLTAMESNVNVSYQCDYDQLKHLLDYIFSNKNKMVISNFEAKYDAEYQAILGTFRLSQYAFIGSGRSVDSVAIPNLERGENETIFYTQPLVEPEEEEEAAEEAEEEEEL
jgi:hypothetical protein